MLGWSLVLVFAASIPLLLQLLQFVMFGEAGPDQDAFASPSFQMLMMATHILYFLEPPQLPREKPLSW